MSRLFNDTQRHDPTVEPIQHGMNAGPQRNTALEQALRNQNYDTVILSLENGANPQIQEWEALSEAPSEVVYAFLESNMDTDIPQEDGMTLLHGLIRNLQSHTTQAESMEQLTDDVEKIQMVVTYGADVNLQDKRGRSPLHVAVEEEMGPFSLQVVRMLIANGANVDIQDNRGRTPLLALVEEYVQQGPHANNSEYRFQMIDLLMKAGANPLSTNQQGQRASQIAEEQSSKPLFRLLRKAEQEYVKKRGENLLSHPREPMNHRKMPRSGGKPKSKKSTKSTKSKKNKKSTKSTKTTKSKKKNIRHQKTKKAHRAHRG
jgi:ankyrin repeat protein